MARCIKLTATLLASLLFSTAHAATFAVTNGGDSGAGTLRAAIESANAAPNEAHTIQFDATYPVNDVIGLQSALPLILVQNLTISGGDRSPQINGQYAHQIFRVSAATTALDISDLSLLNGYSTEDGGCMDDASNVPPTSGTLRITRVVFDGCHASGASLIYGGAIHWARQGASVVIDSSRFITNRVTATQVGGQSGGGAIYTASHLTITKSLFENNKANVENSLGSIVGSGGALMLAGSGQSISISDSTFYANKAFPTGDATSAGYGGAIALWCDACSLAIARSDFHFNYANFGGAIATHKASAGPVDVALTLTNNSFISNQAQMSGGALHVSNAALGLANNTFYNSEAYSSEGAHLTFAWGDHSLLYAHANLFAPPNFGTACSGNTVLPSPDLIAANLLGDTSCTQLSTDSLPNSPLGDITLDETPGEVTVVRFTGSAVIDSISDNALCEPHDARNQQRPIDGDGDGIARCDVGAYEHPSSVLFSDGFED